jgi:hypothetical protein
MTIKPVFHDIEQNTDLWLDLRVGKITSSNLGCIMANFGKSFGEPAKKYAINIAMEQITKRRAAIGSYSNSDMERGHDDEPIAREVYQDRFFCDVTNGGFYEIGDYGCSPDGHVGHNGLIEIKSAAVNVHFERILKKSCDSTTYQWQMIGNLKAAEKEYIDFVSYCQDFHDDGKLFVIRNHAESFIQEYKMIDERLEQFRELIAESKKTILSNDYFIGI